MVSFDDILHSFYQNMLERPQNPWSAFEPNHFENYRATRQQIFSLKTDFKNVDQIKQALLQIRKGVVQDEGELREKSLTASGHYRAKKSKTEGVYVDDAHLEQLKTNQYFTIEHKKLSNTKRQLNEVFVKYPGVDHFEHLKPILSDKLYQDLIQNKISPGLPAKSRVLADSLFSELIVHANAYSKDTPDLLRRLISIHPFNDGNGRSIRLLGEAISAKKNEKRSYLYIADDDFLFNTDEYKESALKSEEYRQRFFHALIEEYHRSKKIGAIPNYQKPEILNWMHPVLHHVQDKELADQIIANLKDKDKKDIATLSKSRNWTQLKNKIDFIVMRNTDTDAFSNRILKTNIMAQDSKHYRFQQKVMINNLRILKNGNEQNILEVLRYIEKSKFQHPQVLEAMVDLLITPQTRGIAYNVGSILEKLPPPENTALIDKIILKLPQTVLQEQSIKILRAWHNLNPKYSSETKNNLTKIFDFEDKLKLRLVQYTIDITPSAIEMLKDNNPALRSFALQALYSISLSSDSDAKLYLEIARLLFDPEESNRKHAFELIWRSSAMSFESLDYLSLNFDKFPLSLDQKIRLASDLAKKTKLVPDTTEVITRLRIHLNDEILKITTKPEYNPGSYFRKYKYTTSRHDGFLPTKEGSDVAALTEIDQVLSKNISQQVPFQENERLTQEIFDRFFKAQDQTSQARWWSLISSESQSNLLNRPDIQLKFIHSKDFTILKSVKLTSPEVQLALVKDSGREAFELLRMSGPLTSPEVHLALVKDSRREAFELLSNSGPLNSEVQLILATSGDEQSLDLLRKLKPSDFTVQKALMDRLKKGELQSDRYYKTKTNKQDIIFDILRNTDQINKHLLNLAKEQKVESLELLKKFNFDIPEIREEFFKQYTSGSYHETLMSLISKTTLLNDPRFQEVVIANWKKNKWDTHLIYNIQNISPDLQVRFIDTLASRYINDHDDWAIARIRNFKLRPSAELFAALERLESSTSVLAKELAAKLRVDVDVERKMAIKRLEEKAYSSDLIDIVDACDKVFNTN